MENEEKDLVWLPKSLCEQIKKINDPLSDECINLIEKYIQNAKDEYKESLQSLDEDVLIFRGLMIQAKQSFEQAKNEQLKSHYEIWERFENDLPKLHEMVDKMVKALDPLKIMLDRINGEIKKIDMFGIERLLKTVQDLSNILGYENNSAEIIKFLFNEYKKSS